MTKLLTAVFAVVAVSQDALAEGSKDGLKLMSGLTQFFVGGGNVAIQYDISDWVFEYSHGFNLSLHHSSIGLTSEEKNEDVSLVVPWTTGGGIGRRINSNWHFLIEAKIHQYEIALPGGAKDTYKTYSFGPSLFYTRYFGSSFFIQPNIRYWPNVGSDRSGGQVKVRRADGTQYEHKLHEFGLFVNLNVGWAF